MSNRIAVSPRYRARWTAVGIAALFLLWTGGLRALSQNLNGDARSIAMGNVGEQKNIALGFAAHVGDPDLESYRSIPIPLGLFQVLRRKEIFDPSDDNFNPLRAMEYAANPMHLTFGRDGEKAGEQLVADLVNGRISRDLTAYRGFKPKSNLDAQGLLAPSWGKTFTISDNTGRRSHGVYVGAGPYISLGTDLSFDQRLIDVFDGAPTPANSTFRIADASDGQVAAAVTAGYRIRVPGLWSSGQGASGKDGLYLAANYNYLYGIHYDTVDLGVQFDTDSAGLVTLQPSTIPVAVNREMSTTGQGFALDFASGVIIDRWVLGFAANGVANRINWEQLRASKFELTSLLGGLDFVETALPSPAAERRVELPVRYSGSAAYDAERWSARAEAAHGLQDFEFHGGAEYRIGMMRVQGGGRYVRDLWHPTGGIGVNLTPGFGIDVAVFTTATNIEQSRKVSFAASLRFNR